ncbi:MAG TPA: squalene synthase HpnC, partial [Gemmatimonadaceae bacterium]|nr:squalene synthase HpnC [Gemmatimonadaceae bacterium]
IGDDIADEGTEPPAERRVRLAAWQRQLHEALGAVAAPPATATRDTLIIAATAHSIRTLRLPLALFDDLVSAFAQDITTTRYDTWSDLADYCRRSANPVGRLVLRIGGYNDPRLDHASDAVCTALQLTNFWQDIERDWQKGRVYVPQDELQATGAREQDIADRLLTAEWRATLASAAARTRSFFDEGREITSLVAGRLRWELRLTWLGGVRILDRLERGNFDVFARRPALSIADAPWIAWRALAWNT